MTRDTVEKWVAAYCLAWESNTPSDIAAAFTADATYYPTPSDPPWVGIDAIVEGWIKHQDEAGSTSFAWELVALDGDTAVIRGVSTYPTTIYDNLWIVRLSGERAREFTEFWVDRNAPTWG